ncbi:hypothetical protein [Faecalicatena contorta]|uniref:hypothetical protein n=1 Tax=Faecalicatena contorta TaxID=39482 RepID=UPI001F157BDC|nr:hypothetical protein [Faecalicatena contorta]MCF2669433.1 hypothetical protein [Faecalicatena contorta]
MTKLLAQHGTAKGKKMDNAITNQYLSGVIFSPREENLESIKKYYNNSSFLSPETTFLDPQLYYSTFEGKMNNPGAVSLLSGLRKPQIRF